MRAALILRNKRRDRIFKVVALLSAILGLVFLATLVIDLLYDGLGRINWSFLTSFPSRRPERAGILSAIVGTLYIMGLTALFGFPLGVGAGIYLEEYSRRKNWLTRLIEINIANLAGVPSIIYGLLGLGVFVRALNLERSLISGALTLALLVLPIIIIASREALKAIPFTIREASYALGATKWQTIFYQVLPAALPGILTGVILALSRAIGETAPLITIGALTYIAFLPESIFDPFTVLPIQVFNWVSRPQQAFAVNAAAAIIVLLAITLILNSVAIYLRYRFQRRLKW
ncbi:MAG TPA: phosphate ABC transporter permease PstA [Thermodesulfobacteriota bacterium]|nr:phosphate ABC transporter permease PstA [Thermodesulfobacteriota bacterium]